MYGVWGSGKGQETQILSEISVGRCGVCDIMPKSTSISRKQCVLHWSLQDGFSLRTVRPPCPAPDGATNPVAYLRFSGYSRLEPILCFCAGLHQAVSLRASETTSAESSWWPRPGASSGVPCPSAWLFFTAISSFLFSVLLCIFCKLFARDCPVKMPVRFANAREVLSQTTVF